MVLEKPPGVAFQPKPLIFDLPIGHRHHHPHVRSEQTHVNTGGGVLPAEGLTTPIFDRLNLMITVIKLQCTGPVSSTTTPASRARQVYTGPIFTLCGIPFVALGVMNLPFAKYLQQHPKRGQNILIFVSLPLRNSVLQTCFWVTNFVYIFLAFGHLLFGAGVRFIDFGASLHGRGPCRWGGGDPECNFCLPGAGGGGVGPWGGCARILGRNEWRGLARGCVGGEEGARGLAQGLGI